MIIRCTVMCTFCLRDIMKNSSRYFCNIACEYYPCHRGLENLNCLFCFCPCYFCDNCPGNPTYLSNGAKDCSNCTFPHIPDNYDKLMNVISTNITK